MHSWHLAMRHGRRSGGRCRCYCRPGKARSEMTSAFAPGQCIFFFFRSHCTIAQSLILDLKKKTKNKKRIMNLVNYRNARGPVMHQSKIKQILQMQIVFTSTYIPDKASFCFLTFLPHLSELDT